MPQNIRCTKVENPIPKCLCADLKSFVKSSSLKKIQSPSEFQTFLIDLLADQKNHRKIQKKLMYLAYHDSLTGLGNRANFQEKIEAAILQANDQKSKVAILFIDMDHFKHFNDVLGYVAGDKLLQLVAHRLKTVIPEAYSLF